MAKRYGLSSMLLLLCVVLCAPSTRAQWAANGIPICSALYQQAGSRIVQDGPDGAIVVWMDYRNGNDIDIYANRIETNGTLGAGPGGVPICQAVGNQYEVMVVSAGPGSAIFAWLDGRDGGQRLYAQKVDTTGTTVWTNDGIDVCPDAAYLYFARMAPDGEGGAIFTWYENRFGSYDIFAQRIDGDGNLAWGSGGIDLCAAAGDQYNAEITADGAGGAYVAWWDYLDNIGNIYAQRVDGDGELLWDTRGVPVSTAPNNQRNPRLVAASGGGAFIAWMDSRTGSVEEVFAQWIDEDGNAMWTIDGEPVTIGTWYEYGPQLADDGVGGAIVAWYDLRTGGYQVYGQRFDSGGGKVWDPNGVMLMDSYSFNNEMSMGPDGFGGAIVAADLIVDESAPLDIYAQRIDAEGHLLWGPRAVVCRAPGDQYAPALAVDGSGGALVTWDDYRANDGHSDLYGQHVGASGLWGDPEPAIVSCVDLPEDQGGWVRIRTTASALDVAGEYDSPIVGYNVWRMIGGGGPKAVSALAAGASLGAANTGTIDRSKLLALLSDPATATGVRVSGPGAIALGMPPGDWESAGFWFAKRSLFYIAAVPTTNDSTEMGPADETYVVTAHTSTGLFVASEPAFGHSVDNVAPGETPDFAGNEIASQSGLSLSWTANAAADIGTYDVYRGDDDSFVPDETNILGSTAGTELRDGTWARANRSFYKLVAVDVHGNRGPAALLRPENVKVGTTLKSFAASLKRSAIELTWALSEIDENAALSVLRSTGGEFAELSSARIERDGAAYALQDATIEPGATYRYRVNVAEGAASRTLFETDAIMTPAMPLTLHQNHPNPFNPSTTISFYLPIDAPVTLDVYDSSGRLVARLLNGAKLAKGTHSVDWRGLDAQGRAVSSGMYFYRLRSGKEIVSRKMLLLR
jgi:hypothetical protein